ncbi:hypothetical protein B0H63DRAFT_226912 [Podospora didyma]|uniref:Uncharacterized protein n=1 Tax=Podospora didyma TaxID=330526 RepID=A0AAE0KKC6_9PEZI|nr:hypothetical protein B0H63DRAFT_226912 [Podospora didyma]
MFLFRRRGMSEAGLLFVFFLILLSGPVGNVKYAPWVLFLRERKGRNWGGGKSFLSLSLLLFVLVGLIY